MRRVRLYPYMAGLMVLMALSGVVYAGNWPPVMARVALVAVAEMADQSVAPNALAPLPLWNPSRKPIPSLLLALPNGKSYLMQRVEEKFASGEQNYKAGHLDAARRDFDDAEDWMLESGYDPNGDPKRS